MNRMTESPVNADTPAAAGIVVRAGSGRRGERPSRHEQAVAMLPAPYEPGRWWREPGDRPFLYPTIVRKLRRRTGGRLLDVGCGLGHFLRRAARGFDVYGVDVDPTRVALARRNSGAEVAVASATELPFAAGSFAVVCSFDVVEHLAEPEQFFHEAARVLRPGGLLLFSTPNANSLGHRRKGRRSFIYKDPTHVSVRAPDAWRAAVRTSGFEIVREGTDFLWDPPYVRGVPVRAQKVVLYGLTQLLASVDFAFPWRHGENYWCLAARCASPS